MRICLRVIASDSVAIVDMLVADFTIDDCFVPYSNDGLLIHLA